MVETAPMRWLSMWLCLALVGCDEPRPVVPESLSLRDRPGWAARRAKLSSRAVPEIEAAAREAMAEHDLPSVVAAALVDGRVLWWGAYGVRDLDGEAPVNAHTLYRIGSVTKVITAMAVLRLRDLGALDLDQPAADFVPEIGMVKKPTADSGPVTIRQMLTHTSGLPHLGGLEYAEPREHGLSEREVLTALRGAELAFAPGTDHQYSNFAFATLGLVIASAADEPYHAFVEREILAPIGMRSARWRRSDIPEQRLATGYAWADGRYEPRHHWKMGAAEAMGGLYASLDDMIRFLSYQMSAWPPGTRPDLPPLRNATLRESHLLGGWQLPRQGTGIGWGVAGTDDDHVVFHVGATHMYVASVFFHPKRRHGVIVMSNTGRDVVSALGDRIGAILREHGGR